MRLESTDAALLVAEDDKLLTQQLHFLRQIAELVRGAHRLPIATQELTHRASLLDAGQLIVWWRCLPSVGRFHHSPFHPLRRPGLSSGSAPDDPDPTELSRLRV